jgi:hypothetical protein
MSFWARHSSASDSTRRFTIYPPSNVVLEMKSVTAEQMDELYNSDGWYKATNKKDILHGVPVYFDPAGRIWPQPLPGWVVVDEIVPDTKADEKAKDKPLFAS